MKTMWELCHGLKCLVSCRNYKCVVCPQLLQDDLAERSVQLEKVKRAGRDLVSTDESPSLKAVDILCAAGNLTH